MKNLGIALSLLVLVVQLLFSGQACAQGSPYFLLYSQYENAAVKGNDNPAIDRLGIKVESKAAGITVPLFLGDEYIVVATPIYRETNLTYSNSSAEVDHANVNTLKSHRLGFMAIKKRAESSYILRLLPSFASNVGKFEQRNFRFLGSALYTEKMTDGRWGLGITYSSQFGDPLVIPIVIFNRHWEQISFVMVLPRIVQFMWKYSAHFHFGLRVNVSGDQYAIRNIEQVNGVSFSHVNSGFVVRVPFKNGLVISLAAERTLYRRFQSYLDDKRLNDFSLEPSTIYSAGISFNPVKNSPK